MRLPPGRKASRKSRPEAVHKICRHIGCEFQSKVQRENRRREILYAHETNPKIHREHIDKDGFQCPLCLQLTKTGVWQGVLDDDALENAEEVDSDEIRTDHGKEEFTDHDDEGSAESVLDREELSPEPYASPSDEIQSTALLGNAGELKQLLHDVILRDRERERENRELRM